MDRFPLGYLSPHFAMQKRVRVLSSVVDAPLFSLNCVFSILLEMISNQNIWIPYHHHRSDYLRKKHPSGLGIWHKAMQTDMVEQARFGLRKTGDSGDSRAFLHLIFTFLNTSLEPLQSIEIPNYRESEGLK